MSGLTKRFDGHTALDDVSLEARDGELLTLLGPSGCGKSTTLWSIAGLHHPDAGVIEIGGSTVFDGAAGVFVPPERRECGVVFQSYAVWPHMTVAENVGYPLGLRRIKGKARQARVEQVLELVELADLAGRYPHQLSGGQQQRVALGRALAHPPRLLLLDEPFSNFDAKLRERARDWLRSLQREVGVTTVFVTHDQDEALSLSDRIAVMADGVLHQVGTPEDVYDHPAKAAPGPLAGAVTVAVRPEAILVGDAAGAGEPVEVAGRAFLGDHHRYRVRVGGSLVTVQTTGRAPDDGRLTIAIPPGGARAYPSEERLDG
jgi:iron(III) transport system ATP-binding protein